MFSMKNHSYVVMALSFFIFDSVLAESSKNHLVALEMEKNHLLDEIVETWRQMISSNDLGATSGQSSKSMADKLADYRKILVTHFVGHYNKRNATELEAINKRLRNKLESMRKYAAPRPIQRSSKYTTVSDSSDFWKNVDHDWSEVEGVL